MKSWKDVVCAIIGVATLIGAHVYVFVFMKPPPMAMGEAYRQLYPACSAYPNGVNGVPCADSDEFERTGILTLHWPH